MYITSDLFGPEPAQAHWETSTTASNTWNSMADSQPANGLGKRKRRGEDNEGPSTQDEANLALQMRDRSNSLNSLSDYSGYPHVPPPARGGILRLPTSEFGNRTYRLSPSSTAYFTTTTSTESRPFKQLKRISPKKTTLTKQPSHLMDVETDISFSSNPTPITPSASHSDLRPCHVCHTAPKRKSDLQNYLSCRTCSERACYVCARDCARCDKRLCSKCCVEVGEEGDTLCLDCYQRVVNTS